MNIYRVIPSTSLSHTLQDAWVRSLISQNKAGPPENKHGPKRVEQGNHYFIGCGLESTIYVNCCGRTLSLGSLNIE